MSIDTLEVLPCDHALSTGAHDASGPLSSRREIVEGDGITHGIASCPVPASLARWMSLEGTACEVSVVQLTRCIVFESAVWSARVACLGGPVRMTF